MRARSLPPEGPWRVACGSASPEGGPHGNHRLPLTILRGTPIVDQPLPMRGTTPALLTVWRSRRTKLNRRAGLVEDSLHTLGGLLGEVREARLNKGDLEAAYGHATMEHAYEDQTLSDHNVWVRYTSPVLQATFRLLATVTGGRLTDAGWPGGRVRSCCHTFGE